MAHKNILHMITPQKHISPFDVNMALDAGYDDLQPFGNRHAASHAVSQRISVVGANQFASAKG